MFLEAHLDEFTITKLINDATPIRIHFTQSDDDQRWIELATPSSVDLIAGKGVRVVSSARVHYAWGGFKPEIAIRRIVLMLRPVVKRGQEGLELRFRLDIEDADLVNVPSLVDAGIVGIVNAAITPMHTKMIWAFEKALSKSFPLPERLEPLECFCLKATGGSATVEDDHLRLRVAFAAEMTRDESKAKMPLTVEAAAIPPGVVAETTTDDYIIHD